MVNTAQQTSFLYVSHSDILSFIAANSRRYSTLLIGQRGSILRLQLVNESNFRPRLASDFLMKPWVHFWFRRLGGIKGGVREVLASAAREYSEELRPENNECANTFGKVHNIILAIILSWEDCSQINELCDDTGCSIKLSVGRQLYIDARGPGHL